MGILRIVSSDGHDLHRKVVYCGNKLTNTMLRLLPTHFSCI